MKMIQPVRLKNLEDVPLYPIGAIAKAVKVSINTLRLWEKKGLIRPVRLGKDRYYSDCDKKLLLLIKRLLRDKGFNIKSIKFLFSQKKCWEIKSCLPEKRDNCVIFKESNCGGPVLGRL